MLSDDDKYSLMKKSFDEIMSGDNEGVDLQSKKLGLDLIARWLSENELFLNIKGYNKN